MDVTVEKVEKLLRDAEARVRALLERTALDDSYGTQVELREAVEVLTSLRARFGAQHPAPA